MKKQGEQSKGKVLVIVAPSGTGKSTLIRRLKEQFPELKESISYTTRPMRTGEEHGRNYFYISPEEFKEKINKGEFLEWATVHSNYYGTSRTFVESVLDGGDSILFDLDIQGADSVKKHFGKSAQVIFIEPPSLEELAKRLYDRGTETGAKIKERLQNAKKELVRKNDYDFLVMNDDIDKCFHELHQIFSRVIHGERKGDN